MKRFTLFLLLLLGLVAQAQEREAYRVAEAFVSKHSQFSNTTITLHQVVESKIRQEPNLFVFDVGSQGFVIVSATQKVLAYSYESVFPNTNNLPENVAYWLELYNHMVDEQRSNPKPTSLRHTHEFQQAVGPLLTSKWGQGCYYNEGCPTDPDGPCSHANAGCVAIAMAQIMYYHHQPLFGEGSHQYLSLQYQQTLSADFARTCYLWEEMCDSLTESNPQVAQLIYHCGVSVNTYYSNNNSLASTTDVPSALKDYFGYPRATLTKRQYCTDEEWIALIVHDLDLGLPLYYAAANSSGIGHAFVCDGYDETGYFHFNFGWTGNCNGFYSIDDPNGFSNNQRIIHDIIPKSTAQIVGDSHGIVYLDPNGTGNGSSWENATSELQAAINKSSIADLTLWLKEGVYRNPDNGNYAFQLPSPCSIYGSFKGDEPYNYPLEQRDFSAHQTILEGNDYQGVLTLSETLLFGDSLTIDGVCIRNGTANNGGGILLERNARIDFNNCVISNNTARQYGGGIMLNGQAHLSLKNCIISDNISLRFGGGLAANHHLNSRLILENCEVYGNAAKDGGGILTTAESEFSNCRIHNNTASGNAGGMLLYHHLPISVVNCIISENTAQLFGGGIYTTFSGGSASQTITFEGDNIHHNIAKEGGGLYVNGNSHIIGCQIHHNQALAIGGGLWGGNYRRRLLFNCIVNNNSSTNGGGLYLQQNNLLVNCTVVMNEATEQYGGVYTSAQESSHNSFTNCIIWGNIADRPDVQIGPGTQFNNCAIQEIDSPTILSLAPANDGTDPLPYVRFHETSDHAGTVGQGGDWRLEPSSACIDLGIELLGWEISIPETDFYGNPRWRHHAYDLGAHETDIAAHHIETQICEGYPFVSNGTVYNQSGYYTQCFPGDAYDSLLVIRLEEGFNVTSMSKHICAGDTFDFYGETLSEPGRYTHQEDCNVSELELIVEPFPELCLIGDTLILKGGKARLTATGADTYLWSTGDTTATIEVTPFETQTYMVTGISAHGCQNEASVRVWVKQSEENEVLLAPNPTDERVVIFGDVEKVELFNVMGERLYHLETSDAIINLDTQCYPSGIYIVHVKLTSTWKNLKLMIAH